MFPAAVGGGRGEATDFHEKGLIKLHKYAIRKKEGGEEEEGRGGEGRGGAADVHVKGVMESLRSARKRNEDEEKRKSRKGKKKKVSKGFVVFIP